MTGRIVCLVLLFTAHAALPEESPAQGKNKPHPTFGASHEAVSWAKRARQGFCSTVWLNNQMQLGRQVWNDGGMIPPDPCSTSGTGLDYPVGTCTEHLAGAGPWIAGIIDGVRRATFGFYTDYNGGEFYPSRRDTARDRIWMTSVGDSLYDRNFNPPRLLMKPANRRFVDDDGDGHIDEDELDGLDNDGDWNPLTDDIGSDGIPDSLEVGCDGKTYDPVTNPDPAYDNYDPRRFDLCHPLPNDSFPRMGNKNLYTEKNGIPDHGEPRVDEDYGAVSESDYSTSVTDTVTPGLFGHIPMGIKVFMKSFAWHCNVAGPVLPLEYSFINISGKTIREVYVGFYVDADVGPEGVANYWTHNYAAYYPDLRTGYIHNAQDRGSTPLGLTVLGTPKDPASLRYSWAWFDYTSSPGPGITDSIIWSWMSCEHFGYNDCVSHDQSPTNPSDTRFLLSFGPFNDLAPGDSLKVSVAFVSGDAVESGPNNLMGNAQQALFFYKKNYSGLPVIPPSPPLRSTAGKGKVTLDWKWRPGDPGTDPLESWDDSNHFLDNLPPGNWRRANPPVGHTRGGRIFEGFRVWRSEAPTLTGKNYTLIAQFDVKDPLVPGYHSGLAYSLVDSNLRQGNDYWYAVTSYSMPDVAILDLPDSAGHIRHDTIWVNSHESEITSNATKVHLSFITSKVLGQVKVVPNPYRGDVHYTDGNGFEGREYDWTPDKRVIWFIDLPARATIRIYSLAGEVITAIEHDDAGRRAQGLPSGQEEWHLASESGRELASGIYIFTVESDLGKQIGKFVVIK